MYEVLIKKVNPDNWNFSVFFVKCIIVMYNLFSTKDNTLKHAELSNSVRYFLFLYNYIFRPLTAMTIPVLSIFVEAKS
jgi:hypothetical protein